MTRLAHTVLVLLLAVGIVRCGPPGEDVSDPSARGADAATQAESVDTAARSRGAERLGSADDVRFEHLSIDDGLSQNVVTALLQDRQGFLWIGTKDGLNRYDGYAFTAFQHDPFDATTLPSSHVTALLESADGRLWVGTMDGGVARFDPATGRSARVANSPRAAVSALAEDAGGGLWIGTQSQGLHRLADGAVEGEVDTFVHDPEDPTSLGEGHVHAILADRDGRLWTGTDGGLHLFENGVFRRYDVLSDIATSPSPTRGPVTALAQTSDGALWAGTVAGVSRLDDAASGRFTHLPFPPLRVRGVHRELGPVKSLAVGPDGALWYGTVSALGRFDLETGVHTFVREETDDGTNGYDVQTVLWDRSDVLWIGTNGYGLDRLDVKSARFGSLDALALSSTFSARSILEASDGRRWVQADRVYVEDEPGGDFVTFLPPNQPRLNPWTVGVTGWSILQDREGALWFSGTSELYRFDPETRGSKLYGPDQVGVPNDRIRGVFEDRVGDIWVVSYQHISRLIDAETGRFSRVRHTPEARSTDAGEIPFLSVHEDGQGRFWIATDTGLLRFDPRTETSQWYRTDPSDPTSISHDLVRSVLADPETPEAVLWIGTAGGGLNRFDMEAETFQHITEADGLPNNVVYGVLPDGDGRLWMSTNRGLARYDPRSGAIRTFDSRDGLQSNEFNTGSFHKGASGRLYFGGIYGVNVFNPDAIVDNPHVPPVVLTDLRIGGQPVAIGDSTGLLDRALWATETLGLSHRENMVTFAFAALDYSAPAKNRYAYRMEGFDEGWIQAGTARTATYTNLPPGRYTFRVRGSNNDGVWNEDGAALAVTVAPPWWRAWWAWLGYALLALGLIAAVYRNRQDRLRLRYRMEFERLEADKLRELDHARSRFFANVSHEFRTPLTLTLGPLDDMQAGLYGPLAAPLAEQVDLARRNAGRVLDLINQILDVARLESGRTPLHARPLDLGAFVAGVAEPFEAMAARKEVTFEILLPESPVRVYADPVQFEKVVANLLSNAVKFTPEAGTVRMSVEASGDSASGNGAGRLASGGTARVSVRDTGRGIPEADLAHVFDRFYQVNEAAQTQLGTGIGLALAKEVTDLHGGTLAVESEVGFGTTFTVSLPLGRAHLAPEQVDEAAGAWTPEAPSSRSPSRLAALGGDGADTHTPEASGDETQDPDVTTILVVEDHPEVRAYVRRHLEAASGALPGYRVLEAADGEEGLAMARTHVPDLVLSDVMMPKLDGLGLCRALKADPETDFIPVILLTAKAAPEDKLDGLGEHADDYLTKPFDPAELRARIANLIGLRQRLRDRFRLEGMALVLGDDAASGATAPTGASSGDAVRVQAPEPPATADEAFLEQVREAITAHLSDDSFSVVKLAEASGVSRGHLHRQLKALAEQTPSDLIRRMRLERAAQLLDARAGAVSEVAYAVGFKSVGHFSDSFMNQLGCRPSAYADRDRAPADGNA